MLQTRTKPDMDDLAARFGPRDALAASGLSHHFHWQLLRPGQRWKNG